MANGPVTRIEWVEEQLRNAILNGDLKPGERLLTAPLSERFSVSPTPLREALHRFTGEGLVEFLPQRGARVAPLTPSESSELAELRTVLDPLAAGHAVTHGDDAWRADIERCAAELRTAWAAEPHDARGSEVAYRAFYTALTDACPSRRLRRLATAVRDQQARYRLATIDHVDRPDLAEGNAAMVAAALDGGTEPVRRAITHEVEAFTACYHDAVATSEAAADVARGEGAQR